MTRSESVTLYTCTCTCRQYLYYLSIAKKLMYSIYLHVRTCTCAYTCTYTRTCIYKVYMCTCVSLYLQVHCTYSLECVHVRVRVCSCTHCVK